ncbi:hypothetical protein Cgig2_006037 [Carnegiea gigantea]|uniref:Dof zinc finger protein n=1 Tax=Carnegiea gigantea TaxID=171969 RepID=A0A9Q1QRV6_9CARY|nr:hypothetical protein Cgig2_006037 [Carnegiea gigantea]
MQDVHLIGAIPGGGRVIGDRRHSHHHHQHQQALKCPRCDSLNTKFCYYNNYNLSQPRHFCKNCRRYWTKGGVLRNVPVGGGCRKKSKRSHPKPKHNPPTNSLSSTEGSTITTATTTSAVAGVFQISESENFGINVGLDPLMDSNHQIGDHHPMLFASEIGGFGNLMSDSADPLGLVGAAETTTAFSEFQAEWEIGGRNDEKIHGGTLDPMVRIDDLLENRGSNCGLDALDWQAGITNTTTGAAGYWSQTTSSHPHLLSQWSDNANSDLPLFLP